MFYHVSSVLTAEDNKILFILYTNSLQFYGALDNLEMKSKALLHQHCNSIQIMSVAINGMLFFSYYGTLFILLYLD